MFNNKRISILNLSILLSQTKNKNKNKKESNANTLSHSLANMSLDGIFNCYDIIIGYVYLFCFILKIPIAVSHYASYQSNAAFHIYVSSVFISILGLIIFLLSRYLNECAISYKLPLLSSFLLFLGSITYCINGVYWSNDECNQQFVIKTVRFDECWSNNFLQFLSVSLMLLYLIMLVLKDLFQSTQRLFILTLINITIITYLIIYLFLNNSTLNLFFFDLWNYAQIMFIISTWFVLLKFDGNSDYESMYIFYAWSALAIIISIWGSTSFWFNNSSNQYNHSNYYVYKISFIGHTVLISTNNLWIIIEAIIISTRQNYNDYHHIV